MQHLQVFTDHLRNQLSYKEFQELPSSLNITLHRLNKLLKGKDDWRLEEIGKVAKLLEKNPMDLIEEWRLGHKHISLMEMDELLAGRGMRVSFEMIEEEAI